MIDDVNDPLVAPGLAAAYLANRLGRSQELWLYRLANWRRPDRKAVIEHKVNDAGNPMYSMRALEVYADSEVHKQAVVAEAQATVDLRVSAGAVLEGTARPHVRVAFIVGGISQSIFALDTFTARDLAKKLEKGALAAEAALGVL